MAQALSLNSYRLLGRSGLRVSPLCLGAMTFGIGPGYEWGANEAEARRMSDIYVDRGGNFIDTANIYVSGECNPAVTAPIMGVRTVAQLEDNLGALDVLLSESQQARLDAVSAIDPGNPHDQLAMPLSKLLILGTHPIAERS